MRFASGGTECAAWFYPRTKGGCLIMTGGFAVTKEPSTDLFARRFHQAEFAVLAVDYAHLGESGGQPRQVARVREQLADWHGVIIFDDMGKDPARRPGNSPAPSSRSRKRTSNSPPAHDLAGWGKAASAQADGRARR